MNKIIVKSRKLALIGSVFPFLLAIAITGNNSATTNLKTTRTHATNEVADTFVAFAHDSNGCRNPSQCGEDE